MFTGIIEHMGRIAVRERIDGGTRMKIQHDAESIELRISDSIAVQGVCLTVTEIDGLGFWCQVLDETLDKTSLGRLTEDNPVNLEQPLRFGSQLGGHLVTGHVDGVGEVATVESVGRDYMIEVACTTELMPGFVYKGSVAYDGISLTVAEVREQSFLVYIIPYTWENTSISMATPGFPVNIETDIIGKYVVRYMAMGRDASPGGLFGTPT